MTTIAHIWDEAKNLLANSRTDLIVVGASVRAAAWSARRAGFVPWCVDLFADVDLRRVAVAHALDPRFYPAGLITALELAPAAPLLYTGALENRPELVQSLAARFPLWGNGADVVRRVRAPLLLAQTLHHAGLPAPRVQLTAPTLGRCTLGRWLVKPCAGAAGVDIRPWSLNESVKKTDYLQEWIDGSPCSALYVGQADGQAIFVGATRQLIGEPWLHAGPFHYCGSLGPLPLTLAQREIFTRLGETLVRVFSLRGIFGVDCVLRDDVPWAVEVNPRYTASVEILELTLGIPLLALHGRAFHPDLEVPPRSAAPTDGFLAKAILFADRRLRFPHEGPWQETHTSPTDFWAAPTFADLPHAGQEFSPGQPVLTLFSRGNSADECLRRQRKMSQEVESALLV